MKLFYAVVFSFLALAGILKDLTVYLTFKANQELIAITMCASKDIEDNSCNGSCYLTKQLEMVHQHDSASDRQVPTNLKEHINYYLEEISENIKPSYLVKEVSHSDFIAIKTTRGFPSGTFEPPKYA